MAVRVMIVDDHAIVRKGLVGVLSAFKDMQLVAETDRGEEVLPLCQQQQPDVVLMDMMIPGTNGIELTQQVRAAFPKIQVLMLTSFVDEDLVPRALKAGAVGYLLKNASIHDMATAIRAAAQGQSTLSPEATLALIRASTQPATPKLDLKEREMEVLALMVEGLTNPQMAERLSLSLSTIKFYVSEILSKLGVESRTEAVAYALKHHLIPEK